MDVDVRLVRRTDVTLHLSKEDWLKVREMLRLGCTSDTQASTTEQKVFVNDMIRAVDEAIRFEESDDQ